jgi:hypothetical protein
MKFITRKNTTRKIAVPAGTDLDQLLRTVRIAHPFSEPHVMIDNYGKRHIVIGRKR